MGACPAELDIKKANRNMDALYSLTRSVVTKGAMMVGGCILAAAMKIKLGVVASVLLCTAGSVLAGDALAGVGSALGVAAAYLYPKCNVVKP